MNKNTAKAIQRRLDSIHDVCDKNNLDGYDTQFVIGNNNYVLHFFHPELEPFVMKYSLYGTMNTIGVIRNWKFIPDVEPERRTA